MGTVCDKPKTSWLHSMSPRKVSYQNTLTIYLFFFLNTVHEQEGLYSLAQKSETKLLMWDLFDMADNYRATQSPLLLNIIQLNSSLSWAIKHNPTCAHWWLKRIAKSKHQPSLAAIWNIFKKHIDLHCCLWLENKSMSYFSLLVALKPCC